MYEYVALNIQLGAKNRCSRVFLSTLKILKIMKILKMNIKNIKNI